MSVKKTIKYWPEQKRTASAEVTFPVYTEWGGDSSTTYNRLDETGDCISISIDIGAWHEKLVGSRYEFQRQMIDLTQTVDSSYLDFDPTHKSSESKFMGALRELVEVGRALLAEFQPSVQTAP